MDNIKLIYFEGCPEAKNAKSALLSSGISDFEIIEQGTLNEDHPLKRYSSPSILKNGELILGSKLAPGASACSYQRIDPEEIKNKLGQKEKRGGVIGTLASLGSGLMVGFCPACVPAIGAFLSSIGLGIIVQDNVLRPALIVMLLLANGGLLFGYLKKHQNIFPLMLGLLASVGMYIGRYVFIGPKVNMLLMYGSIPFLIGAAFFNLYLENKAKKLKGNSSCC